MANTDIVRFSFLLAVALSGLTLTPPAHAADTPEKAQSEPCDGHLTRLRGDELVKAVSGHKFRFAGERGVCAHSDWYVSYWLLELDSDGQYRFYGDRAGTEGRYIFDNDRLCLNSPAGRCEQFYRDEAGRLYMLGPHTFGSEPAMIKSLTWPPT